MSTHCSDHMKLVWQPVHVDSCFITYDLFVEGYECPLGCRQRGLTYRARLYLCWRRWRRRVDREQRAVSVVQSMHGPYR